MKKYCFLILSLTYCIIVSATNLNGEYLSDNGSKILISDSTMYYIEHQEHNPMWYNDTLAICNIRMVSDHFFEINSPNPYEELLRNMKVHSSYTSQEKDSILIVFNYPYNWNDLVLSINIGLNTYRYQKKSVRIPISTKRFSFSVEPTEKRPIHTVEGKTYGIVCLAPIPIEIEPNANRIEIEIPTLDNHFFEKFYIKNEYVYYDEKTIKWKGDVFLKSHKSTVASGPIVHNSCSAFNCDSLSLIIKDKQLSIFPYYYEKTICDNYIRRDNAGLLKKVCSAIQKGDTIYLLEMQDRLFYESNYASIWKKNNPDSIYSFNIYNDVIHYEKGSLYPKSMIEASMDWDEEILIKAGELHIRRWTGRAEVILTRIVFVKKDLFDIDCLVFFNFNEDDYNSILMGKTQGRRT